MGQMAVGILYGCEADFATLGRVVALSRVLLEQMQADGKLAPVLFDAPKPRP